jgi:hypothetical protein
LAALVSTTHGLAFNDFAPSPSVFNHCIVRLRLDGVSYWLDPTAPVQSGSLPNIYQPHGGWALPLTRETMQLESLDSGVPLHILHAEDEPSFGPKQQSPATLRKHIDYFSWTADQVRNRIANEGAAEFAGAMLKQLQATWPGIIETRPMEISDDEAANCFTVKFTCETRDAWKLDERGGRLRFHLTDTIFGEELRSPRGTQRQTEVYLGRPRKITRHVRMNMLRKWFSQGWRHAHQASGLSYIDNFNVSGTIITNTKELMINA